MMMRFSVVILAAMLGLADVAVGADQAAAILDATGVRGGLIVHVGCGDGKLTAALRVSDSYIVHGLDTSAKNVAAARKHIRSLGVYGKVSVDRLAGVRLAYRDNLVNLVVAEKLGPGAPGMGEVMRVLCPRGVAYIKEAGTWRLTRKPRPKNIDDWTHYLHDATNNAVAHDTVVGPPKRLQWVGSPKWARHHDHLASTSALVSAGGRIFYIFDEAPAAAIQLPPKWSLIARDAHNGCVLWKRPIGKWHAHLWPLKSGPAQLPRRLVAVGDRVYVTLGLDAATTALDAATGRTVQTYEASQPTEEIITSAGAVFLLVDESRRGKPREDRMTVTDLRRDAEETAWSPRPRAILAAKADTGERLWRKKTPVVPLTLAADERAVYFHDGNAVVCLNRVTGAPLWTSKPVVRARAIRVWFAPTLVVYKDVVLFAGAEKMVRHRGGADTMTALSAKTGQVLWTAKHPPSGYDSPQDVLVAGGLVWTAPMTNRRDSGTFTGRDPVTGEVKVTFRADDGAHMPHHRCHRAKATDKYILASRTGIELVDFRAKHWNRNDWVRGSCLYGIMPANGLIYTPPHSCACYILGKQYGFNALAPASKTPAPPKSPDATRLERGAGFAGIANLKSPAFAEASADRQISAGDWPTYRRDAARSGRAGCSGPTDLRPAWTTAVGGRLSAPVIAGGKLFVASIDTHTVCALDADSGKKLWSHMAGGRVDSPPTVYRGRVLFGSADGWVYCLRAGDGELVWRFRAAPADVRMTAFEQVESVWPIHGSVLVRQGMVYCVAGRSMFLDGGMRLVRLDAVTGRKISETVLDNRHPKTGKRLDANIKWPNLPVALGDVLSCDAKHIYMRTQRFDFAGRRREVAAPKDPADQTGEGAHLFCPTGFLDGTWWHRTYWIYGKSMAAGAGGWYRAAYNAPVGRIMVCDESSVYGFGRRPRYFPRTTAIEYHLFAASKQPKIVPLRTKKAPPPAAKKRPKRRRPPPKRPVYHWSQTVPLLGRAMVLAGKTLFVAGPPDVVDQEKTILRISDAKSVAQLADQTAALEGKRGGLLWAVDVSGGKKLGECRLKSPPVWDGLAAAGERLYLADMAGNVVCLGKKQ